jgi:hypothetical protein
MKFFKNKKWMPSNINKIIIIQKKKKNEKSIDFKDI